MHIKLPSDLVLTSREGECRVLTFTDTKTDEALETAKDFLLMGVSKIKLVKLSSDAMRKLMDAMTIETTDGDRVPISEFSFDADQILEYAKRRPDYRKLLRSGKLSQEEIDKWLDR